MRVESTTFNVAGSNDDDSTCINRQARLFIAESRLHSATYELVVLVVDHHSPKPQDPSLVDRIWSRISGNRDPPEMKNNMVARYNIALPNDTGSLPQPTLVSLLRNSTTCSLFSLYSGGLCCDASLHRADPFHWGKLAVYGIDEMGMENPVMVPFNPDESHVQPSAVRISDTGAIMVHGASEIVVSYYQ
jgi:hypothetical protein